MTRRSEIGAPPAARLVVSAPVDPADWSSDETAGADLYIGLTQSEALVYCPVGDSDSTTVVSIADATPSFWEEVEAELHLGAYPSGAKALTLRDRNGALHVLFPLSEVDAVEGKALSAGDVVGNTAKDYLFWRVREGAADVNPIDWMKKRALPQDVGEDGVPQSPAQAQAEVRALRAPAEKPAPAPASGGGALVFVIVAVGVGLILAKRR